MSDVKLLNKKEREELNKLLSIVRLDTSVIKRKYLNIPYSDDRLQSINIYLPESGDGPFPAILFVHGGGWSSGDKSDSQVKPFLHGINRGYAVVSVGYRLLPNIRYPQNLFDIKAALRWCFQNGPKYSIDPERLALAGASAGAHLALLAGFTQGQAVFEGAPLGKTCKVRAIIDLYGPTDLLKTHEQYDQSGFARAIRPDPVNSWPADELLGTLAQQVPNLMRFMNPIDNVHPDIPPVLILHGHYDPMVPYQQSTELAKKITDIAGADRVEMFISEDCSHADTRYEGEPHTARIFGFLDTILRPKS